MPRQYRWRFLAPGQRAVVEGTVDEVVAIFGMLGGVAGLLRFEPAPSRRWSRT